MSLLVVGSIALDTVHTPYGKVQDMLGGSAIHFSFAASLFYPVRLVGVVGRDFPYTFKEMICKKNIDTKGLQEVEGETFRWNGKYKGRMNEAETICVNLNVFANFKADIPEDFKDSEYVFLANCGPSIQLSVLKKIRRPRFVLADTMNLWIKETRTELLRLLKEVDGLVLNDGEAYLLTQESNIITAGKCIQKLGPKFVIIKKGEHGSILFGHENIYLLPAYPTREVKDPTGAGDSFAGGLMGYIASAKEINHNNLKTALIYGTITASYNIEDFGVNSINRTTMEDIKVRFKEFEEMIRL